AKGHQRFERLAEDRCSFRELTPVGFPCVLYIGVSNDGTPESKVAESNLENVQASFAEKVKRGYPRIAYYPRVFRVDSQQVLAMIIPGSELKPHFTQRPHIRNGQQTLEATDVQFEELIAQRSSKAAYILKHKNERITAELLDPHGNVGTQW